MIINEPSFFKKLNLLGLFHLHPLHQLTLCSACSMPEIIHDLENPPCLLQSFLQLILWDSLLPYKNIICDNTPCPVRINSITIGVINQFTFTFLKPFLRLSSMDSSLHASLLFSIVIGLQLDVELLAIKQSPFG